MIQLYTDDARRVRTVAHRHAKRLRCAAVGLEHLLVALIEYGRGPVEEAFFALEVTPGDAWAQADLLSGAEIVAGAEAQPLGSLQYTLGAQRALGLALEERRKLRDGHLGSEHLLLAVLRQLDDPWAEPEPASVFLERLGLDPRQLRQELLSRLPADAPPEAIPSGPDPSPNTPQ